MPGDIAMFGTRIDTGPATGSSARTGGRYAEDGSFTCQTAASSVIVMPRLEASSISALQWSSIPLQTSVLRGDVGVGASQSVCRDPAGRCAALDDAVVGIAITVAIGVAVKRRTNAHLHKSNGVGVHRA